MTIRPARLLLPMFLTACSAAPTGGDGDDAPPPELPPAEQMERVVAEDLASLGLNVADAASGPEDAEARSTGECYATVGTCQVCVDVDGSLLEGTFGIEHTPLPCGWEVEVGQSATAWTLEESWLEGSWEMTHWSGDFSIEATAARQSLLEHSGRSGSSSADAKFEGTLEASVQDYALAGWSVSLEYAGFGDHEWSLDAEALGEVLSGTVSLYDGAGICGISGTVEAPVVECLWE